MAAKLAFVLSHDYGELFNAVYFGLGGAFESVLLLPPKLHQANASGLPFRSHVYRNGAEIAALLERERPDAVVFFSGYLLVINQLLAEQELEALLTFCGEREWPLVTSDPSLGLIPRGEYAFRPGFAGAGALSPHFARLAKQFADAFHVYLAPCGVEIAARHGSYYNPRCVLSEAEFARRREMLFTWSAIDRERPRWLFVLSPEDEAIQFSAVGRLPFVESLASRLRDVARAGRQAVLIAPPGCLAALQEVGGLPPGLVVLNACGYLRFMLLLHEAEYVFYWNTLSASMLARVIHRQPIFTFAPGHLEHALEGIGELGRRHFYLGESPTSLDLLRPLELEELESLAAEQQRTLLAPVSAYLATSPTPDELVARILEKPKAS